MQSSDDTPQFSADTMRALMEFYKEQEERELKRQEISEGKIPDSFEEDWNMSQFWYTEETSKALALECKRLLNFNEEIACISCPTLYKSLRKLDEELSIMAENWSVRENNALNGFGNHFDVTEKLLEFDTRFAVYKDDFIFYDFRSPLDIPKEFRERFSVVVADPPYLSEDCLTKTAITIKFLAKPDAKIILCTGATMQEMAYKLLKLKMCFFPIKHHKRLSNPFACYANYDLDSTCTSAK